MRAKQFEQRPAFLRLLDLLSLGQLVQKENNRPELKVATPPKNQVSLHPANKKDMSAIADIIRSSATWYEPFLEKKDLEEHYVGQEWIEKNYKKRDFYLGKNKDGETIGTISMQFFGDVTYLGYIYLHTEHTGNGYGKKLIDFAKKESIKKGQDSMILIAHPEATWAVKAYERYGFKRISTCRKEILEYRDGLMKPYYEEGFHLYEYSL